MCTAVSPPSRRSSAIDGNAAAEPAGLTDACCNGAELLAAPEKNGVTVAAIPGSDEDGTVASVRAAPATLCVDVAATLGDTRGFSRPGSVTEAVRFAEVSARASGAFEWAAKSACNRPLG